MNVKRRTFCAQLASLPIVGAGAMMPWRGAQAASKYPNKPVSIVVPFAPGGNTDIIARMIGTTLSKQLDANLVIENKAGAGGNIGAAAVARARPDGYTLLYSTASSFAINPHVYSSLPFDPRTAFEPLAVTIQVPVVLVVTAESGIKTLDQLAAHLRKNPDTATYGSSGTGTSSHIACHVLAQKLGVPKAVHVPYKQGPQVLTDLAGGQLTYAFDAWSVVGPQVKSGRLVALAVSGKARLKAAPDVPTVEELLHTDFDVVTWNAYVAPAGLPAEIAAQLREAIQASLRDPTINARVENEGVPAYAPMTAEQTRAFFESEYAKWGELVKLVGATGVS
ncbi:LacI family transcriptional regulator [Bordetella tumbae]|uniref:Bug family tripartite tricarboxylate transporter substrate binding protein n=1 Tax=Bordetella tumbae TaxID=1649139 RepID=UPI0039EFD776